MREIHITGIQCFDAAWMARLARAGVEGGVFAENVGKWMDHLPLTEADWEFVAWALQQVSQGAWGDPWVVTLEYGGTSPLWDALTEREILAAQVPRLYGLVQGVSDCRDRATNSSNQ